MHCHCQPYFEIKAEDNGEFFKWLDIDQRQDWFRNCYYQKKKKEKEGYLHFVIFCNGYLVTHSSWLDSVLFNFSGREKCSVFCLSASVRTLCVSITGVSGFQPIHVLKLIDGLTNCWDCTNYNCLFIFHWCS